MEKENLVLLHGWGMGAEIWKNVESLLSEDFSVFCIELPDYQVVQNNADLDGYLDRLVDLLPERAHWLGWSLGGMLATLLANRYPSRAVSLTLIATNTVFCQQDDWLAAMEIPQFEKFQQQFEKSPSRTLESFLHLQFLGVERGKQYAKDLLRSCFKEKKTKGFTELKSGLELLAMLDIRFAFGQLSLPLLLVNGELDRITPVASVELMAQINPAIEVEIISDAGHAPFICHKKKVVKKIHHFLLTQNIVNP